MHMTMPTLAPHLSVVNDRLLEFLRETGEGSRRARNDTQTTLSSSASSTTVSSASSTPDRSQRSTSTGTTISFNHDAGPGRTGPPAFLFHQGYDQSISLSVDGRTRREIISEFDPIRNVHIRRYIILSRIDRPQSSETIPPEVPLEERARTTLVSIPPPQLNLASLPTLAPSGARLVAAGAVERVSARRPGLTLSENETERSLWKVEEVREYVYDEDLACYVLQR